MAVSNARGECFAGDTFTSDTPSRWYLPSIERKNVISRRVHFSDPPEGRHARLWRVSGVRVTPATLNRQLDNNLEMFVRFEIKWQPIYVTAKAKTLYNEINIDAIRRLTTDRPCGALSNHSESIHFNWPDWRLAKLMSTASQALRQTGFYHLSSLAQRGRQNHSRRMGFTGMLHWNLRLLVPHSTFWHL